MERVNVTNLNARVYLRTASHTIEWSARVDRVSGNIDPLTQTLGVIVSVDHPFAMANPGERPPLLRDTFVEIELSSDPILQQIVIPGTALHEDKVYVLDKGSRINKRKVEVGFTQRGFAVITAGLKAGETIVISDLLMATEGLLVKPQEDKKSLQKLILDVTKRESDL